MLEHGWNLKPFHMFLFGHTFFSTFDVRSIEYGRCINQMIERIISALQSVFKTLANHNPVRSKHLIKKKHIKEPQKLTKRCFSTWLISLSNNHQVLGSNFKTATLLQPACHCAGLTICKAFGMWSTCFPSTFLNASTAFQQFFVPLHLPSPLSMPAAPAYMMKMAKMINQHLDND